MAWTAPKTFSAGGVLTASDLNTHLRDNLLETCPATATTSGSFIISDGANSMGTEVTIGAAGRYLVSSGSAPVWTAAGAEVGDSTYTSTASATSFAAFSNGQWGSGTSVSFGVTVSGTRALVKFGAQYFEGAGANDGIIMTYAVSGATTIAATDREIYGIRVESAAANLESHGGGREWYENGTLTNGTNTFTLHAKTLQAASGNIVSRPYLIVFPY